MKWTARRKRAARAKALAAVARLRAQGVRLGRPPKYTTEEQRLAARRKHAREAVRRWRSKKTNRLKERKRMKLYRARPEVRRKATLRWLEWRRKNPEKAKAISARYYWKGKKNPKTAAQRRENHRKTYQRHKAKWKAYEHKRRVREHKDCADLAYTASEWTAAVKERFALFGNRCAKCRSTKLLEVDHVVPLALGGSHLPENTQPLCRRCNRSKGARFRG